MPARVTLSQAREIRRRHEDAQAALYFQCEVRLERRVELGRRVVAGPDGAAVHAHGDGFARKAHGQSLPAALPGVVGDLPGAPAANHREYQPAPRPDQACALGGNRRQVGYAVERAEVGVGTVELTFARQALQFMRPQRVDVDRQPGLLGPLAGARHHARRPVGGRDLVTLTGQVHGVQAGAAAQVDEPAPRCEAGLEPAPHLGAHVLDGDVVATGSVVVGGHAVEGLLGVRQAFVQQRRGGGMGRVHAEVAS